MTMCSFTRCLSFWLTTTGSLRVDVGRNNFMFELTTSQCRQNTNKTKLIIEWNNLPYHLRKETSQPIFKTKLKTHYTILNKPSLTSFKLLYNYCFCVLFLCVQRFEMYNVSERSYQVEGWRMVTNVVLIRTF